MTSHRRYFYGSRPRFESIRAGRTKLWITHPGQFRYPVREGDRLVLSHGFTGFGDNAPDVRCTITGLVNFWTPAGKCLPIIGLRIEVPANRPRP